MRVREIDKPKKVNCTEKSTNTCEYSTPAVRKPGVASKFWGHQIQRNTNFIFKERK